MTSALSPMTSSGNTPRTPFAAAGPAGSTPRSNGIVGTNTGAAGGASPRKPATPAGVTGGSTPTATAAAAATPSTVAASTTAGIVDPFFGRVLSASSQSYVRSLSGWSIGRLEREPRLLAAQVGQLQAQLEDLSLRHYPTFLRTHHVLRDAQAQLGSVEVRMGSLASSVLPALEEACAHFQSNAPAIVAAMAKQRSLAAEQNFLLELLEVPALMDTAFKNNLVHEALQLDLFVKELVERQQQQAMTALATAETEAAANQITASDKMLSDADTAAAAPPIPAILLLLQQVCPSTHSYLLLFVAVAVLLRF
jgi:hypothetical protein